MNAKHSFIPYQWVLDLFRHLANIFHYLLLALRVSKTGCDNMAASGKFTIEFFESGLGDNFLLGAFLRRLREV